MKRSVFAMVMIVILLLTAGLAPTLATCTVTIGVNITCDSDNDTNSFFADYSEFINAGGGNDSILSYGSVGDNSTTAGDGLIAGTGADIIVNNGTVRGQTGITDGTGSGNDTSNDILINSTDGVIIAGGSGIVGGGQDYLSNDGSITGIYGLDCLNGTLGQPGCTMYNSGTITTSGYGVYGASGNDYFQNTGVINDGLNLSAGDDYVYQESGTITGQPGDAVLLGDGNDSLYNVGPTSLSTSVIGIGVYGQNGNDLIINSMHASITGIDGGPGNDSLRNFSLVSGVMVGGDGNDTVINNGGGLSNYIAGDVGNDSVVNGGAVNTSLVGGVGQDTVTNFAGGVASWLDGGADNDIILNGGFINANLIGGAGADSLVNFAGAFAAQIYGDGGNDTIVNGGFINGELRGGDDNDRVTNLGGATAVNISGDFGNDSVFNGGYLVGQLYGGGGNDTVVNAAFSYSAGAQLGDGDDSFANGGYLNGSVQCGSGNDTVSLGGFINGGVSCGDGSDVVAVIGGVTVGVGATVTGIIDGGPGVDGLSFAFTVHVPTAAAQNAITAALAAASPAGGTITIAGVTYTWVNFEGLFNLLSFVVGEPTTVTITIPRRVNQSDAAAPVAVYCAADGVELWTVGADGAGSHAFNVPYAEVSAGTTVSAAGVTFESTAGGSFSVSATASDGKPYTFTGSCS